MKVSGPPYTKIQVIDPSLQQKIAVNEMSIEEVTHHFNLDYD